MRMFRGEGFLYKEILCKSGTGSVSKHTPAQRLKPKRASELSWHA